MATSVIYWDTETIAAGCESTFLIQRLTIPRDTAADVLGWQFSISTIPLGNIYVEMRLGREALTAGFVPLSLMVLPDDLAAEAAGLYTFRLRKPMRMESGEYLTVRVQNRSAVSGSVAFTLLTKCVTAGTTLIRELPFFAAFVDTARAGGTSSFTAKSTEAQLRNPFPTSLFIDRLIGRYLGNNAELVSATGITNVVRQTYVRIADWLGNQIVQPNTPFDVVFTPEVKAWIIQTKIPANAFFIANLINTTSFNSSAYTTTQALIGLIASRTVSMSRG
jgi:hypothetical protein